VISVIVPAYNEEAHLSACLESLFRQEYDGEYEVLVVDDGSTDATAEVARRFGARLLSQDHRGPAAARNLGAREARGAILLFTDADCVPQEDWLREMVLPFEEEQVAAVQGCYRTRQRGLVPRFAQLEIEVRYERMKRERSIDFIGSYAAAYRREVFLSEGGFDEAYPVASGEDPDLSYRLASRGYRMVFNPRAIVYHRHPETLLSYLRQKFYRAFWRVLLYRKNREKALRDSYTPQLLKLQILLFYLLLASLLTPLGAELPLFLALLLTFLPTSLTNLRKDPVVGVLSPLFLFLRTAVFATGLVWGVLRLSLGRRFSLSSA
jgi:cellulose synthase/poly-beta-1,6-N-acetylglucosamine synthase-like glycosyltransferase